jgi:hypothetical protein
MPDSTAYSPPVQARAAATLTALLTEHPDAPVVVWQVTPGRYGQANLVGQSPGDDDASDRRAVAAWAAILGTVVVEEAKHLQATGDLWTDVRASSDTGGVAVQVWAMVDRAHAGAVTA